VEFDQIKRILSAKFDNVKLASTQRAEITARCPLCDDRGSHLGINLKKWCYHCWRCDAHGHLGKLFAQFEVRGVVRVGGAGKLTARRAPFSIAKPRQIESAISGYKPLTGSGGKQARLARAYLHDRGVTDAIVRQRHVGYAVEGRLKWRVILPHFNNHGLVIYYAARRYMGEWAGPPYDHPPEGADWPGKTRVLFGQEHVQRESSVVRVCEGPFDALAMPSSVALLGKSVSEWQIEAIAALRPGFVEVFLDADARRDAAKLGMKLRNQGMVVTVRVLERGDPASIMRPGREPPRMVCLTLSSYLRALASEIDLFDESAYGRASAAHGSLADP